MKLSMKSISTYLAVQLHMNMCIPSDVMSTISACFEIFLTPRLRPSWAESDALFMILQTAAKNVRPQS